MSFGSHSYFKDFPEVIDVPKVVAKVVADSTTAVSGLTMLTPKFIDNGVISEANVEVLMNDMSSEANLEALIGGASSDEEKRLFI